MADGKIVIEIGMDTSNFEKNVKQLENTAKDTGKHIWEKLGGNFKGNFLQGAFSGLIDLGSAAIESASNLEKVQNALDVTFGDDAGRVETWAASAREQFGLTELQAKQYTSTLGAMLKGMDVSGPQMLEMSTGLAGLAADMASFYNMDSETAFNEISKGLTGQSDKLRQLGVDLSDANMEAYALSEGMGKTFQQMSSGEQAVLRYQYLMKETAAVQGNFAKTSESLAGNMQMLETNWNELLVGVGEAIEPLVSGTVDVLNDVLEALTGGSQSAAQQIDNLSANLEKTTYSIEEQAFVANHLADKLISMGDYSSLSAEGQMEWKAIAEKLLSVMPGLSSEIDTQTGSFKNGTKAVRDHIKAMEDELKLQALYETKKQIMQTAVDSQKDYYAKLAEYEAAEAKRINAQNALDAKAEEIKKKYSGYDPEQFTLEVQTDLSGTKTPEKFGFTYDELYADAEAYLDLYSSVKKYAEEAGTLEKDLTGLETEANDAASLAKEQIDALDESIKNIGGTADESLGDGGVAGKTETAANEMANLGENTKSVDEILAQIEQYRFENLAGVRQELEDTFGLFDKPGRVKKGNIKGDTKNIEDQAEYWERYNAAVEALQEREGGDAWVAELADGSEESLSKLEMLAGASDDAYQKATDAKDAAQEAMDAAAESISESKLKVDETYNDLIASTEGAVNSMNMETQAYASGAATMNGLISGISDKIPGLSGVITIVSGLLSTLGGLLGAGTSGGGDGGGDGGAVGPQSVRMLPAFEDAGGYSTGLSYVPYNDFPAILHEGEAVLTKAQASLWRAGWTGAWTGAGSAAAAGGTAGGGSFQQVNNFNVPVQTPDEFAKTMRLYATYGLEGVI